MFSTPSKLTAMRAFRGNVLAAPKALVSTAAAANLQRSPTILRSVRHSSSASLKPASCKIPISSSPSRTLERNMHTTAVIPIDGEQVEFSPILLRDFCQCPACVHESSRQRLYSTADIPANIQARSIAPSPTGYGKVDIQWTNDIPGFDASHTTTISVDALRQIHASGSPPTPFQVSTPRPELWSPSSSNSPEDFGYESYMKDDATVYSVVKQLRTQGLVFIIGVPDVEQSVAAIGERIGPIRDTFYGRTWDVRTVPKAINAAYTSADLGFHTDLLYFQDPPHLQLLHCIQSSSKGGASVFADAFKAALDLYETDQDAFNVLTNTLVTYHYEHPSANLYAATKPVIDTRPLRIGNRTYQTLAAFLEAWELNRQTVKSNHDTTIPSLTVADCLEKINWGPPFLAPFSLDAQTMEQTQHMASRTCGEALSNKMVVWHSAAAKFSRLLNRPEGLHERLMKPGECVIFDNTRALHARRAFDSGDVGQARWLRGAYVDRDPYWSKFRVLKHKLGDV
ncbi:hypothetical protein LTR15_006511 [Elasticomyces elasticus]|nr:hypothetical protein LTR15_006511 [Elasticomyces elasticus]